MPAPHPLGLHVNLMAAGPTLRFVVWFERAATPRGFESTNGAARDAWHPHPNALTHPEKPEWLPAEFTPERCLVAIPRLGSYYPIPLPGLITAWDLAKFKTTSRAVNASTFRVPAWVLPPSFTLFGLRKLLHDWSARYGPGFVSAHAPVLLDVLDGLKARLSEGPLLPSIAPNASRWKAPCEAPTLAVNASAPPVWTPALSLGELQRIDRQLRGLRYLPALRETPVFNRHDRPSLSWVSEALPARLGVFLLEVFGEAVERAGATTPRVSSKLLREAVAKGDATAAHRDHGSCLYPQHPIFSPPAVPFGHLHGRLHPLESTDADGNAWELELGLVGGGDVFLPLESLLRDSDVRRSAVEHDGTVWFHPASIVERDLRSIMSWGTDRLAAPEALSGRVRLTEAAGLALLSRAKREGEGFEYARWLNEIGSAGRPRPFTAFNVLAALRGAARVRVHWDLTSEGDPSLHSARFTPRLEVSVGDAAMLAEDVARLIRESTTDFMQVHGRVIARADLAAALDLLRAREKVLARLSAVKGISWSGAVELDDEWSSDRSATVTESVFAGRWEAFLARLQDGAGVPPRAPPEGFLGTLRPYQLRGLSWLSFLIARGFGGCLADDMGLGKTVQVLATLALHPSTKPYLVVSPTSVVLNWAREARKFTPTLRVHVHQGAQRVNTPEALRAAAKKHDAVVTSYALLRRDSELFETIEWATVVLDEAQNLKNPDAQQTRVAKSLTADAKLCLTGTPVENHLRDLWSIYDVALPGLLGGAGRFARAFLSPIRAGDSKAMARLTKRVGPFLLRRMKSDPGVATDLPDKQEQDVWCDLTTEQVGLYRAMADATLEGLVGKDGIARRAHILGALTHFKQICNHPENFQRERPTKLFGRSGKLDRAMEIVGELLDASQRVLVFTQFTEMGRILQRALDERFEVEADFYHGGLGASAREEMVSAFNAPDGPAVLIVSLKAGGTGLNLTAASAVIHYDRWWNPAVEDQATDRAHRIGQTRKVNVYKFVARATLEERIVAMLESKRELASKVLGASSEAWITELDDKALREFFTLGDLSEES